jgi:hypothetical protein
VHLRILQIHHTARQNRHSVQKTQVSSRKTAWPKASIRLSG